MSIIDNLDEIILLLYIINQGNSLPKIKKMIDELYGYIKSLRLVKVIEYTYAPGVIKVFEDTESISSDIIIVFLDDVKSLSMSGSISILEAEQQR